MIHIVGPRWDQHGGREGILAASCRNGLRLAREIGSESITYPAISTGIHGYSPEAAARVASVAIREDLHAHEPPRQVCSPAWRTAPLRTLIEHALFED